MKANDPRLLVQRFMSVDNFGNPRPKGVFVGFKDDNGKIRTGFSRCNYLAKDKFNIEVGIAYAIQEAILPNTVLKDTPENQELWDNYNAFVDRAKRYFTGKKCHCGFCERHVNVKPKGVSVKEFQSANSTKTMTMIEKKIRERILEEAKKLNLDVVPILNAIDALGKGDIPIAGVVGIADQSGYELLKKYIPELAEKLVVVPV